MRTHGTALAVALALVAGLAGTGHGDPRELVPRDGSIEAGVVAHDTRDPLYRQPWGAAPVGTEILLRLRTAADDATAVRLRLHDAVAGRTETVRMDLAGASIACYEEALADRRCDWWEARVVTERPTTLSYRFEVADGPVSVTYRDDAGWSGGRGTVTGAELGDLLECCFRDFHVTVHDPAFEPIGWLSDAVVYQILPDRFRNGDASNDPTGDEPRYDWPSDPMSRPVMKDWDELPEGHCRSYVEGCDEPLRHRDYFGGDIAGITASLDHLADLGVTALYLNPIFAAASNHGYDTRDYTKIQPSLGTDAQFDELVAQAGARGIRLILDGVFVATSSDSLYFDRNRRFGGGACSDAGSPYRGWFSFRAYPYGPCAGDLVDHAAYYESWHGIDLLPLLDKTHPGVRDLVYGAPDAVARRWLEAGAAGWRIDSMLHESFPDDFWRGFRTAVKQTDPQAPIVGELWHRGAVLPKVRGDMADGAMNYRFRGAVLSLFGNLNLPLEQAGADASPSRFAELLLNSLEDVPPAAALNSFNLLDSHDSQRILWRLTPGRNGPTEKQDPAHLAEGAARLKLAALIQMTTPGAPTIYYGSEAGVTGDNDPDNRRTYPWGREDADLRAWHADLIQARAAHPALRSFPLQMLHADDDAGTAAYARGRDDEVAVVVVNAHASEAHSVRVELEGVMRDGVQLVDALTGEAVTTAGGAVEVELDALSGAVLVPVAGQDLDPPDAPSALQATVRDGDVELAWDGDAVSYRIYRSPLSGAGHELVAQTSEDSAEEASPPPGRWHYTVRAVDAAGNEGPAAVEAVVDVGGGR